MTQNQAESPAACQWMRNNRPADVDEIGSYGKTRLPAVARSWPDSHNTVRTRWPDLEVCGMPSAAFDRWLNDRTPRLNEVEAHCAAVLSLVPSNLTFLDETLRGY